jgi:hypothetical protein
MTATMVLGINKILLVTNKIFYFIYMIFANDNKIYSVTITMVGGNRHPIDI